MNAQGFECEIKELIRRAFSDYEQARKYMSDNNFTCLVDPGFPILWFGDLDAYFKREKNDRAVTIGVNPSGQELKRNNKGSFIRYPNLFFQEGEIDAEQYRIAMNEYFMIKQYKWFSIGMDHVPFDYSDGGLVHIDCCSSIATRPSWSRLCQPVKVFLRNQNKPIFEGLLKLLGPSKVFVCSNKAEKAYITKRCVEILHISESSIELIDKYK